MEKTLDLKLNRIREDSSCADFILADAKDGDMGFGIAAPGVRKSTEGECPKYRTLEDYRHAMREITRQGLVDIMLMSASTSEKLTMEERLFDDSSVTPAVRANDTTDIWLGLSGAYSSQPSLPFRTATIDHIQCGKFECSQDELVFNGNSVPYIATYSAVIVSKGANFTFSRIKTGVMIPVFVRMVITLFVGYIFCNELPVV